MRVYTHLDALISVLWKLGNFYALRTHSLSWWCDSYIKYITQNSIWINKKTLSYYSPETFTNAPSTDLQPFVLEVFVMLMRVQAHECMLRKLQMETSRNSCDYEVLLVETHCLMNEYAKIHFSIQSNSITLPACWEALVPLKTEYYKSLAHLYFAKRFSKSSTSEIGDEKNRLKTIKAHLQASQAAHEEILRLQRMCRELRVSWNFYFLKVFMLSRSFIF